MNPQHKQEVSSAEATRPGPMFTPAVDILESESAIIMLADMPGVTPDGLNIRLEDSVLTIDGRVDSPQRGNETPALQEYEIGSYHREFKLTNLIDQARIDATLRDGVLRLTLPKAEAARPRKIEVRAS